MYSTPSDLIVYSLFYEGEFKHKILKKLQETHFTSLHIVFSTGHFILKKLNKTNIH